MADPRAAHPCPICGKPAEDARHRPFCSGRCRQVDLGRWFGEVYRVPGPPPQANGEPPEEDPPE
jgi:endogenous inhibitor of DNA gyrase (YacG/DUF329 family)